MNEQGVVRYFCSCWKFVFSILEAHHVTIGLFEANDTMGVELARQLKTMLKKFGLTSKVLCYVKDKGTNLANMTIILNFVISCEALNLLVPFDGACFGHVMSKAAQYVTNDDKISKDLVPISVKSTQMSLQSCITWPKKLGELTI
jgi:hypothetical protein